MVSGVQPLVCAGIPNVTAGVLPTKTLYEFEIKQPLGPYMVTVSVYKPKA